MLGAVNAELGAIPCGIAWLYKGINEKRQKTGARFSVRVSALGVNATKPGSSARDLLAAHATGNYDIHSTLISIFANLFIQLNYSHHPFVLPTSSSSSHRFKPHELNKVVRHDFSIKLKTTIRFLTTST